MDLAPFFFNLVELIICSYSFGGIRHNQARTFHLFVDYWSGSLSLGAVILINHVTREIRSANQISNEHINRKFNPALKIEDAGCHPG